jgi:hypothetical protein
MWQATRIVALAALGALMLGGCEDTNRPLTYDKGEYGGRQDQKLLPDEVEQLRQRTMLQNG